MKLVGKIKKVNKTVNNQDDLEIYSLEMFDINNCASSCLIDSENGRISLSKWVSPKRTRSEPFSRVYKTLGQLKSITVIPVIKDEGANGDCDHFNPTTLAWMNLLNIYIILVPYISAEANTSRRKITNQKFDNEYVKNQIKEILNYRSDAHHYNNEKFNSEFQGIYNQAVREYRRIGNELGIQMHDLRTLDIQFEEYLKRKNLTSIQAAQREQRVTHATEFTIYDKAIIKMENFYNGKYYLTIDEVFEKNNKLILREAKNSTTSFPSPGEITDAFFKCLLFLNIDILCREEALHEKIDFDVEVFLTGRSVKRKFIFSKEMDEDLMINELRKTLKNDISDRKIKNLVSIFYKFIKSTDSKIVVGEYND